MFYSNLLSEKLPVSAAAALPMVESLKPIQVLAARRTFAWPSKQDEHDLPLVP
jgi:hypothetical protein